MAEAILSDKRIPVDKRSAMMTVPGGLRQTMHALKKVPDPNGIIAPGRYSLT